MASTPIWALPVEQLIELPRAELVGRYAAGGARLNESIEGLTSEQMAMVPVPGTWSIAQIVIHMLDADLIGGERMRRIIAEDQPRLEAFDESRFVERLFYTELDAHRAAELFVLHRAWTSEILRKLNEADFLRVGLHSEAGPMTLAQTVAHHTAHLEHHLKFIQQKRQMV